MSNNSTRIQVQFTSEQYNLIKKLKGELGSNNADVVRTIVLLWLTENSFIVDELKKKISDDN